LTICWWVAVADATLLTVIAVERITRQLLPLAALLNLSLAFPDQAPRRFAVARRVGRPRDLQHQLEEARAAHGKTADIAYMQTILELIAALSVFDHRTRGHVDRVRVFTEIIAAEMHLPDADRARLRWAAMLHDIGKLTVPAEVLNKKGSLNPASGRWSAVTLRRALGSSIHCGRGSAPGHSRWSITTSIGTAAATRAGWSASRSPSAAAS